MHRLVYALLALILLSAPAGLLVGCGGEKVPVGETLDTDPRQNEDVMKRTQEFYEQQAKKQGQRR